MESLAQAPRMAGMAMKIGVMGAATGTFPPEQVAKAEALGEAIARRGCLLITGGCPGLPLAAARGAKRAGGWVIGISPGLSLDEHMDKYGAPTDHHDVLIFTGSGLMGREVVNIRSSDIVIIVGGRSGTLGELAIAYDEGKLLGILTGTGGITDIAKEILAACEKDTGARVVFGSDPAQLVEELLHVYTQEHYRRPSVFSAPHDMPPEPGMVRDVVCGMWLRDAAKAAERMRRGRRYLFCSPKCVATFDANPANYERPEST